MDFEDNDILKDFEDWRDKKSGSSSQNQAQPSSWDASTIKGESDVHDTIRQIVQDLAAWSCGELPWKDVTASLILEGEPGSGKTYLAREIANCIGKDRTISTSYAEWQGAKSGHLGNFLEAMKKSFDDARNKRPSFLFIDEIDSFGTRGANSSNKSYDQKAINGFLAHMDMDELEGVIVIGACNDASGIDPAILRDGRFDEVVQMEPPGPEMVAQIVKSQIEQISDEDLASLSRMLIGVSPAKIAGSIRKVKSECRRTSTAFDVQMVLEKALPDPSIRDAIWRRVALHECGHAIAGKILGVGAIKRVLMRSDGSGFVQSTGHPREGLLSDYQNRMAVLMAGSEAERILLGEVSSGAGGSRNSDIAQATNLALAIEARFGLGGERSYREFQDADWSLDATLKKNVDLHILEGSRTARSILRKHLSTLKMMSNDLIEKRVLSGDDLCQWLDPLEDVTQNQRSIHRHTEESLVLKMWSSSLKCQAQNGERHVFLRLALSKDILVALTHIGWHFGEKIRDSFGNPDIPSSCASGLDYLERILPDHAVLKYEDLRDFGAYIKEAKIGKTSDELFLSNVFLEERVEKITNAYIEFAKHAREQIDAARAFERF